MQILCDWNIFKFIPIAIFKPRLPFRYENYKSLTINFIFLSINNILMKFLHNFINFSEEFTIFM